MNEQQQERIDEVMPDEVSIDGDELVVELPGDIDRAMELYRYNPVVREVVDSDVRSLNEYLHGVADIYQYQPAGFLYDRLGQTIRVDTETVGMV